MSSNLIDSCQASWRLQVGEGESQCLSVKGRAHFAESLRWLHSSAVQMCLCPYHSFEGIKFRPCNQISRNTIENYWSRKQGHKLFLGKYIAYLVDGNSQYVHIIFTNTIQVFIGDNQISGDALILGRERGDKVAEWVNQLVVITL